MFKFSPILIAASITLSNGVAAQQKTLEATSTVEQPIDVVISEKASARKILQQYLSTFSTFTADFAQQVFDSENQILQESLGSLKVQKPNLVNWHTVSPDESILISDGKALWHFDPFIEQVSVYSVNDSVANTPVLLLSNNDESLWQQYTITQNSALEFTITSNDPEARVKSLALTFDNVAEQLVMKKFSLYDSTGQKSNFSLLNFEANQEIAAKQFTFVVPDGVEVDDQR